LSGTVEGEAASAVVPSFAPVEGRIVGLQEYAIMHARRTCPDDRIGPAVQSAQRGGEASFGLRAAF